MPAFQRLLMQSLITTGIVLLTIWTLNRFAFGRQLVANAFR